MLEGPPGSRPCAWPWRPRTRRWSPEAAERHGLDLPLPRAWSRERMEAASDEHGEKDMAATYLTAARR